MLTMDLVQGSGMAVVSRRQPDLLDVLFEAVPHERDFGLSTTSLEELREMVSELPFDTAMVLFARLAAEAWHVGTDEAGQLAMARDLFNPGAPVVEAIAGFLKAHGGGAVFAEQQLFALMRLVLEHSPEGAVDESDAAAIERFSGPAFRSLFAALSVVTDSIDELPGGDEDRRKWLAVLIQNGGYNAKTPPLNAFTRAHRLLQLAELEEVGEPQDRCDVNAWLVEDYRVTPAEQFACGFALAAAVGALSDDQPISDRSLLPRARLDDMLEQLQMLDRKDAVLDIVSAPREWYVERFARGGTSAMDVAWRRTPFEAKPFLRWGDGHLLLLSPRALLSWLGEGFHHRVFACAERRGDAVKKRYSRFFGQLVEAYALELAESAYPAPGSARRVHGEQRYGKGGGSKTSDIAVDCAPDLVLFEVAGGRLTEPSRVSASWDAVEFDLKKLILARIKKLDGSIAAVLARRARIPHVPAEGIRHIWPVIVTAGDVFQSELLWDYIDEHAGEWLNQREVQPLTLLDLDDFELLLGMVEAGASLVNLLERKAQSPYRKLDLQQWRTHDPTAPREHRPVLLSQRMHDVFTEVVTRLGFDPAGIPEDPHL